MDKAKPAGDALRAARASLPVRTHLLIMVLLPVLGMGALTVSVVGDRMASAGAASEIDRTVKRISDLTDLRAVLFREAFANEVVLATGKVGIGVEAAGRLSGSDLRGDLQKRQADTDRVVARDGSVVTAADVADARFRSEAAAPSDTVFTEPYIELGRRIDADNDRSLAGIRPALHDLDATDVVEGLEAIRSETELLDLLSDQIWTQSLLYEGRPPTPLVNKLVADQAREQRILQALGRVVDPSIRGALDTLNQDPDVRVSRIATQMSIDGTAYKLSGGPEAWNVAVAVTNSNRKAVDRMFELVDTTTRGLRAIAGTLESRATSDLHRWAALGASLMVVSVGIALLLARAISRPLRRLAERAESVSAGHLEVDVLPADGPRDIAVTSLAFNDLVGNLRVLDGKAQALAACDLDAPALWMPLPGPLGRSLERSAELLSGSLSERDLLRRHILDQAGRDNLTGLRNRLAIGDALRAATARARSNGVDLAVLIVDLDDFKRVNDIQGHVVGDALLRCMARRLTAVVDERDVVGRLGNDEFVIIREQVEQPGHAFDLAQNVLRAVDPPMREGGRDITVTASIGIALFRGGEGDADTLLAWADLALDRAKQRAGRAIELYDRDIQEQLLHHAEIERALRHALSDDELFLVYQPVVDLALLRPTSVEALIRWQRPSVGLQAPDSFIPVAETSDLIIDIDRWVLDQALAQLHRWQSDDATAHLHMAVNVSGRHLVSQTLSDHVATALERTGVDPHLLTIEITETVLVADLDHAAAQLRALRDQGVRVAIDDFGTGFASIAHLQQLPADILKLDRSFVSRVGTPRDRTLLALMSDVGHHLGLSVTAEGIETHDELDALRSIGCDHAQGYLLSRPALPGAVADWARACNTEAIVGVAHPSTGANRPLPVNGH